MDAWEVEQLRCFDIAPASLYQRSTPNPDSIIQCRKTLIQLFRAVFEATIAPAVAAEKIADIVSAVPDARAAYGDLLALVFNSIFLSSEHYFARLLRLIAALSPLVEPKNFQPYTLRYSLSDGPDCSGSANGGVVVHPSEVTQPLEAIEVGPWGGILDELKVFVADRVQGAEAYQNRSRPIPFSNGTGGFGGSFDESPEEEQNAERRWSAINAFCATVAAEAYSLPLLQPLSNQCLAYAWWSILESLEYPSRARIAYHPENRWGVPTRLRARAAANWIVIAGDVLRRSAIENSTRLKPGPLWTAAVDALRGRDGQQVREQKWEVGDERWQFWGKRFGELAGMVGEEGEGMEGYPEAVERCLQAKRAIEGFSFEG